MPTMPITKTTTRTPEVLADAIESASGVFMRWTWDEIRTIQPAEKDMIVAALRRAAAPDKQEKP